FYTKQYGSPAFGSRFIIAQTDDETMEAYSGQGILFLASRFFDSSKLALEERLQREVAYQWWGQTIGLKSFDDAWISQGLAEWSALVDDFERLTSQVAGKNIRYFFAQWVEGTGVPEFGVDYQIIRTRAGKFRTRGTVRQNFENLQMPVELTLHSEGDSQTKALYL